jgi:hypothetical protein
MPEFILSDWCAWAPGLCCADNRLIHFADTKQPNYVPKLLHRRLSPLAKAVFNVARTCIGDDKELPVVFSSAHGEICKSLAMLQTIQAGQELSPTAFSLSVHNAIAGLFSIAFKINKEVTVIAPGQEGVAPAFVEALGLLHEGEDEVLVILYDEPIADFYPIAPFNLNLSFPCVLGLKVALTGAGLNLKLCRSIQPREDGEHPVQLLALIKFLLADEQIMRLGNQGHSWTWQKQ